MRPSSRKCDSGPNDFVVSPLQANSLSVAQQAEASPDVEMDDEIAVILEFAGRILALVTGPDRISRLLGKALVTLAGGSIQTVKAATHFTPGFFFRAACSFTRSNLSRN